MSERGDSWLQSTPCEALPPLLSGPKSCFQIKVILAFHLEIKVWSLEEEWRGTESKLLDVQCEVSTVCDDLGCRDVCWCSSIVFYHVQNQCRRLPGDFGALKASQQMEA